MTTERSKADERLDEIYRDPPEEFVAGRDRLVKELRAAGKRDEATAVGKLRRPTEAAWLLNRTALSSPAEVAEFAEASRDLERAQADAIDGGDAEAAGWRAAASREREAASAVVEVARSIHRDLGRSSNARVLELVTETLRAAVGDPELRQGVTSGRLERQQSGATLGALASPGVTPARRRKRPARAGREVERARRELKRLEDQLAEAERRRDDLRTSVAEAEADLRAERTRLEESERAAADLERRVEDARRSARPG